MKRLVSILLVMLLAFGVFGCSAAPESASAPAAAPQADAKTEAAQPEQATPAEGSTEAAVADVTAFDNYPHPVVKKDLTVGFLHGSLAYPSTVRTLNQLKIECNHYGWTYIDGLYESNDAIRDVWRSMINAGCDAIYFQALENYEAYSDLIAESRNAGIGLYAQETGITDGIIAHVTMPAGAIAAQMAYDIGDMYNYNAKVGLIAAMGATNHVEAVAGYRGILNIWNGYTCLGYEDAGDRDHSVQNTYDITQAWIQQYGEDLNVIYTSAEAFSIAAAEAVRTNGFDGKILVASVDGTNDAWAAMEAGSAFQICNAAPHEYYVHTMMEVVYDLQVLGMNPGDEGCHLDRCGQTLYCNGTVVYANKLPVKGEPIHSVFDYYDPNLKDAWWDWEVPEGAELCVIDY